MAIENRDADENAQIASKRGPSLAGNEMRWFEARQISQMARFDITARASCYLVVSFTGVLDRGSGH
jgi:hypothetical protein